jgi:hypothetical protein
MYSRLDVTTHLPGLDLTHLPPLLLDLNRVKLY